MTSRTPGPEDSAPEPSSVQKQEPQREADLSDPWDTLNDGDDDGRNPFLDDLEDHNEDNEEEDENEDDTSPFDD